MPIPPFFEALFPLLFWYTLVHDRVMNRFLSDDFGVTTSASNTHVCLPLTIIYLAYPRLPEQPDHRTWGTVFDVFALSELRCRTCFSRGDKYVNFKIFIFVLSDILVLKNNPCQPVFLPNRIYRIYGIGTKLPYNIPRNSCSLDLFCPCSCHSRSSSLVSHLTYGIQQRPRVELRSAEKWTLPSLPCRHAA